ncbi:Flp pilus assembly protein CpaB [Altererythrobacter sp. SALINAS58]|uniref:Flp pilus assembly protein CpaB n=1 Tax=Alteripontixanthobacter muriae TaxID=2705546 RepID=UPI0015774653|nr:Flp pilus assembly protein CpaB [Alteripontixanthobacter muriae]NTZ41957.1 Flp pilus assembly protein CpaB [Alteripontixanthobacter muriae]
MRGRNLAILGIALFFGLVAVYLANSYFSGVEQQQARVAKEQELARIVVATQDLGFGGQLSSTNLRLANWPADTVPAGAFRSVEEATAGGRVALRPIVAGEPILSSKVSGEGGRATLSSVLPEQMRAVSIPIDAVTGVSGFVRAGDVVDVMLTRQIPGEGASASDMFTTVVLENVQVLAVDQTANESETAPAVGKTATVQTDIYGAQKLTLANKLGSLSLALRNVEDQMLGGSGTVLPRDLGGRGLFIPARRSGASAPAAAPAPQTVVYAEPRSTPTRGSQAASQPAAAVAPRRPTGPTMQVVRGTENEEVEVNRYGG